MSPLRDKIPDILTKLLETGKWDKEEILSIIKRFNNRREKICPVCGIDSSDYRNFVSLEYMVKDSIWTSAGLAKNQIAHIQCLEIKLGRPLILNDFSDFPINNLIKWALNKR